MKKLLAIFTALLMAVTLVGCDSNDDGDDDEPDIENAQVRFVHASPDAGPVDVQVDGEDAATGFSYEFDAEDPTVINASGYLSVPVDVDADITVLGADGDQASINADQVGLEADTRYTVIVAGAASQDNSPQAILLEDDFRDLGSEEIGLRLVHGSALAGNVDIYLGGNPLVQDFQFGQDTGVGFAGQFVAQGLSGETQLVEVYPAGADPSTTEPALALPIGGNQGLPVQAGTYITGIAADVPDGSGSLEVGAQLIAEPAPSDN